MNRGRAGSTRTSATRVLVAHPSPDLYGSDWQLVETIHGLIETGHEVLVALPQDGPLVAVLRNAGARVAVMPFTVLRKALLSPTGLARLSAQAAPVGHPCQPRRRGSQQHGDDPLVAGGRERGRRAGTGPRA